MARDPTAELLELCPKVREGLDWRGLSLRPEDGFLLSRIDGVTSAETLSQLVSLSAEAVIAALTRLERAGAILWRPGGAPDPALDEPGDLPREERERILAVERRLESITHWELLGVGADAGAAELKRAYFEQSRAFHPDRYFGRELGSFKERLHRIFKAVKAAYDVLADERERARYAEQHPPPAAAAASGPAVAARPEPGEPDAAQRAKDEGLERRRQAILAERRQKRTASVFSQEQAREAHAAGLAQLKAHDFAGAAEQFRRASAFDPSNPEYKRLHDEVRGQLAGASPTRIAEQAEDQARAGKPLDAAPGYMKAFELSPTSVEYALRAAELFLAGGDATRAWASLAPVLGRAGQRRDVRLAAASVLEAKGDIAGAIAHLEALASLDKGDPHVKKLISRLVKQRR